MIATDTGIVGLQLITGIASDSKNVVPQQVFPGDISLNDFK
jgi:hypothetical protein